MPVEKLITVPRMNTSAGTRIECIYGTVTRAKNLPVPNTLQIFPSVSAAIKIMMMYDIFFAPFIAHSIASGSVIIFFQTSIAIHTREPIVYAVTRDILTLPLLTSPGKPKLSSMKMITNNRMSMETKAINAGLSFLLLLTFTCSSSFFSRYLDFPSIARRSATAIAPKSLRESATSGTRKTASIV